ncbi:putative sensory box sensor histidine kinase/response regulator [Cyclobacterium qasimii M12-11B]|uniref:histidine kinase n=2 Tax=Cyclobacterium qasimii TaxID=1350429 RepID=S7WGE5_9BACT|nr:putative sensory box sensor histidine kinase/response regulator [Cyclobacterium qasimii M12-11B]
MEVKYWEKIKRQSKRLFFWDGNPSMEVQIYNAILVIIFFIGIIFSISNLFLGNQALVWSSAIAVVLLLICFYLLRVKNAYKLAFYISSGGSYPLLAYAFFYNDGINGPNFYMFLLVHLIILSILKLKFHYVWTLINMLFFTGLFYIGLYHEEWIPKNYVSKEAVFLDHVLTYFVSLIGISILINSIKRFYAVEKEKVKEKSIELTQINRSLTKTSAQKDKIITIISHDLKNPLQSIIQTLELMDSGELSEEEIKFLRQELLKTTNRTYKMMENILEWSSFEIKNMAGREKEMLVKELVEDTVEILKVIAKQKSIQLEVNYHKNPLVYLETDRLLLIFRNLVQNAIKFTPAGGLVTIDLNCLNEQLILEITDNGIGISADRLSNIFAQDIKSTYGTEQEKGTGMGLHLCYQSAHKLNGELKVDSTEGVGSSFKLIIPTGINR